MARMLVTLLALAAAAAAETELLQMKLNGPWGPVGDRVGTTPDVNGDGLPDVLALGSMGVLTYSASTGVVLGYLDQPMTSALNVRGIEDLDGGGKPDLVVAAADSVRAFSRETGGLLWTHPGSVGGSIGWRMAIFDDLDGDGIDDVGAGEPDADPHGMASAGTAWFFSGADGSVIHAIEGSAAQQQIGRALAVIDDLSGDGIADVILGNTDFVSGGMVKGLVMVLSPLDGSTVLDFTGDAASSNFGMELADLGDLDGDGLHDIGLTDSPPFVGGKVRAYSGADGSHLWSSSTNQVFNLLSVGDTNADGAPELVTAGPGSSTFPGSGQLFDGATGTPLLVLGGSHAGSFLSVAAAGDMAGDGTPEIVIGHSTQSFSQSAFVWVRTLPSYALVQSFVNGPDGSGLGRQAAWVGDRNEDGIEDVLLVSDHNHAVFSGADGAVLDADSNPNFGDGAPAAISATDDVDGDGAQDLLVGDLSYLFFNTGNGRLQLWSGAKGKILANVVGANFEGLGGALATTWDHDEDGVADAYVSAHLDDVAGVTNSGEVRLVSGATLATLDTLTGAVQLEGQFGTSLAINEDLDGDGVADLAVGSRDDLPGKPNSGTLYVLSGVDHSLLMQVGGALNSTYVAGEVVADATGDHVPDVLVTEPMWISPSDGLLHGRVRMFSGATGAAVWDKQGPAASGFYGERATGAGDLDGDGYGDVAFWHVVANVRRVAFLSGLDGSTLDDFATGVDFITGALLRAGYHDAGGSADMLVGSPGLDGNGGARILASSQGGVHGWVDLGHGKAGSNGKAPTLRGYGDLAPDELATISAKGVLPSTAGLWFIGLVEGALPFKGGVLVPSPAGPFFSFTVFSNALGEFAIIAPNPSTVFAGLALIHQFWWSDPLAPNKVSATNGMREIFKDG